jgi:hypothetical protein
MASAWRGCAETKRRAWICATVRFTPQREPISPQWRTNFWRAGERAGICSTRYFCLFRNYRLKRRLSSAEAKIAAELLKEIRSRLRFLLDVGLSYLTPGPVRAVALGGQRIRLASQIGSELTGVIYVLDEPSIGGENVSLWRAH